MLQLTATLENGQIIAAVVTLNPVSVSVSPGAVGLTASQTQQFAATVSNTSNTAVKWSLSPPTGTISSSGLYAAPSTISSTQTVTVTATSVANSTKSASATVTLTPPANSPVTVTLTPGTASLSASQTQQFAATVSNTSNTAVGWSLSAPTGTISSSGLYTAPATINATQTVTVTATSSANSAKSASATVTLNPPVTVTLTPGTASLAASQTQQFAATVSNTSNTAVGWSLNPPTGTISSSGLYTAPATINATQTVTVTATSVANSAKTASATVTLNPAVTVTLTPATVTLSNSQTQQFSASVMGTTNTAVIWSLSALVGTLTANGQYTAPSPITSPQTVTVIATSVADQSKTGRVNVTLMPSKTPPSVSLTSPTNGTTVEGNVTLAATASDNVGVVAVQFYVDSVALGSPLTSAPYTTSWNTTTYANGSHTVSVTAWDAAGNTASQSASVTVSNTVTSVLLPIEVVGPAGTTQTATVNIASPVSGTLLSLQIHNLKYETEASIQINRGAWIAINTANSTILGLGATYGGIGGGFGTLQMTLSVPNGLLVSGANTVTFRFNGTDGNTSGFRVLSFNFLAPNGTQLVNASSFVQDDPNTWQPPSTQASDIAAGQSLWQTGKLVSGNGSPIQATCSMCHAQDGRDLKYFNYSNGSIEARAMFHGLNATQAMQVASYIRSLSVPNPGRPWNPPYQPGPGLDSQPVENWAAGAGLSLVLDNDQETFAYLAPGGSATNWAPSANVSARETPIALQLPDWNRWLPRVHPVDAWSDFAASQFAADYPLIRSLLIPGDATSYVSTTQTLNQWYVDWTELMWPKILPQYNPTWTADYTDAVYSTALWRGVKTWEINQEFSLEGMNQAVFGPQGDPRGWWGNWPFFISPNMQHIPEGSPGIDNGLVSTSRYTSLIWYQLQMILNDSSRTQSGTSPLDYPYVYGFIKDNSVYNSQPQAALQMLWLVKGLQESETGIGPDAGGAGWQPWINDPSRLVHPDWAPMWSQTPPSTRTALNQAYLQLWFAKVQTFTPQQWYTGGWATPSYIPVPNAMDGTFGDRVWFMIPQLLYIGVDPNLMSQIANWAKTVWPAANWSATTTAVCSSNPTQGVICSTQQ